MEKFGITGQSVSVIGQGTWGLERHSTKKVASAIERGIDLGITHIDTAEMYGAGRVEQILSNALKGRRDEVFLVSKVLPGNATFAGTIDACEASLSRLRTDRLDCYLLHWFEGPPMEETFRAFEELKSSGKIRSWGVSNFTLSEMKRAEKLAGPGVIACNQVEYNVQNRQVENEMLQWCRERSISVVAHSPFGDKRFPGRMTTQGRVLARIAKKHNCSTRVIVLAFLMREQDVFVIPRALKIKHLEDNVQALNILLDDQDIELILNTFPS